MTEQAVSNTSSPTLPLKAVLFDLDDTLFDHTYSSQQGLAALIHDQECFRAVPMLAIAQVYAELLETYHIRVLQGTMTLDEARIARTRQLFAHYGAQIERVQVEQAIVRYMTAYRSIRQVVPGGLALLQALHTKVHIAVVTNNLTAEQVGKIQACGLEPFIDTLVTAEDVGAAKPDPVMFETALKRAGCTPQEAVVIGDSWSSDIVGAQRAGMRAIWLNRAGLVCPDATIATEIQALEPVEQVLAAIYQY